MVARGAIATGLALVGVLTGAAPSIAGSWTLTPAISVRESFSDNVSLATENEDRNSDLITVVSPGLSLRGQGGRINLNFDYLFNQTYHLRNTSADSSRNNLVGNGSAELWDRVLFLDAAATISRQVVDARQPSSNSIAGEDVNRTTTRTVTASPIFRHHIGNWVDTESTIRFSHVSTESDVIDKSLDVTESFTANSGKRFTVFLWSLNATKSKLSRDNSSAVRRTNIDGTFSYVVNPKISLIGGVGWEDIESDDLTTQPRGINWNAGFNARPNSVSSLRFTVGDRNETTTFDIQASYQLARTSISANYSETIQTTQQQLAQDLGFLSVDPVTGQIIDTRTGQPFVAGDEAFGLTDRTFRQRRLTINLSSGGRRTRFGGGFFWEERDIEATNRKETGFGGDVRIGHPLSSRLNTGLNSSFRITDPGTLPSQDEIRVSVGASMSYSFARKLSASLRYDFSMTRIDNSSNDTHENAVTLSLRKAF